MTRSIPLVLSMFLVLLLPVLATQNVSAQTILPGAGNQSKTGAADVPPPSPNDIGELMRLLSDPAVVGWLKDNAAGGQQETGQGSGIGLRDAMAARLDAARTRVHAIGTALASLPQGIRELNARAEEIVPGRGLRATTYVLIFLFVGAGLEWLYWQYLGTAKLRIEIAEHRTLGRRFSAALARMAFAFGAIAVFSVGSVGTFLLFEWPSLLEGIVVNILMAIVTLRAFNTFARFILAPRTPRLRLVPLDDASALQFYKWGIGTAFLIVIATMFTDTPKRIATATGEDPALLATAEAVAAIAAFVVTAAVIIMIWRLNPKIREASRAAGHRAKHLRAMPLVQTALMVLLLLSWLGGAYSLTGTILIVALLIPSGHLVRVLIDHFYDEAERGEAALATKLSREPAGQGADSGPPAPPESSEPAKRDADDAQQAIASRRYDYQRPIVHRIARLAVIVIAVMALGGVWGVNIFQLSQASEGFGRIAGIAIDVAVVLLLADLVWTWTKTAIDRRLAENDMQASELGPGPEARILTLLPIFRMTVLITLLTVVGLTALSSMGVNIAPLLAGAGVAGIAIGFGAQALVRDVVSGIFFLLDDAFRVGEYIEMDNLRGTVESMSLRSLKVRHHRGAVHTIPFGELKSLTNYSRDWVIMKLEFRVPFHTDVALVKKLVKRVGAELQANENYGKYIIEPLKSQGVRRMEEFNMVIGVKFMAKPGAQWVIRRDAYQKLRDAFEENGINFAERNVKVEVVANGPLSEEQKNAAVGAAQPAIEKQLGQEGAALAPDEP